MGMENWLELLVTGPAEMRDLLLAKCHDFFVKEINAYRDAGADVLVYSNPFGSTDTVSMKYFLEHSLPWIEKEIRAVGPAGIVYYCGTSRFNRVIETVLERCHAFFVKEITAYRDAGADVLVYSNPFGSTDTVSMKYFLEHSLPWIEKDIRAVGTAGIVYYCGTSRFNRVIDTVLERTGIGVYYLSPLDDLAEGKRIIAGRGLTCGVINDIRLIDWTREEIRAEVRRLIEAGMPGGKFLFGTGVMPLGIPEANIRTLLEAAYEFGSGENGRIR
jgi:uroporphyrinogen-III decarboxylase